jgi:hypothetical protein
VDEDLSTEGLLRSAGREDLVVREIPSLYLEEEALPLNCPSSPIRPNKQRMALERKFWKIVQSHLTFTRVMTLISNRGKR